MHRDAWFSNGSSEEDSSVRGSTQEKRMTFKTALMFFGDWIHHNNKQVEKGYFYFGTKLEI